MVRDESRYDDRATAEAARDAAPRGGRRTSGSSDAASGEECACGTETAGKSGFRLFTGDRVLWIIVAALAVISVLVVYSSTAKMAYVGYVLETGRISLTGSGRELLANEAVKKAYLGS